MSEPNLLLCMCQELAGNAYANARLEYELGDYEDAILDQQAGATYSGVERDLRFGEEHPRRDVIRWAAEHFFRFQGF